ncbi:cytochrome P450 [Podospora didyma]|uniref:Cytochrome P450 n=1 Tax=Podospora didyma TaxID=330526 RepID=A0AAE0NQZ7_9PEZI|nr:cytochrome P450 [Podospora didyma]
MDVLFKFTSSLATFVLILGFVGIVSSCIRLWALPRSLPVAGAKGNSHLSRTRAYLTSWLSYHRSRAVAYAEFSKLGKPFISPNPSLSPDIVIPPQHVKWLLSQPSSVVAQRPALWEGMAIRYMFTGADPNAEFVPALVKRHMSLGNVDVMQAQMYRSIQRWTDISLGTTPNDGWKEVSLFDAVGFIMQRVGYRLYFGPALAENEELGQVLQTMGNWAAVGGLVIGQFSPMVFRKPLGWLFRLPLAYYTRRYKRIWEPVVREKLERVQQLQKGQRGAEESRDDGSATAGAAEALARNRRYTVESMSSNFMIMYGIAANVKLPGSLALLLNLITLPEARTYLPLLRQEIETVLFEPTAWTDPETFTPRKMPLATAFTRESMRYSPLVANIPVRTVVARDGVILPDGTQVPCGASLSCPAEAMTRDERFFPDPDRFNPFRFLVEEETPPTDTADRKRDSTKESRYILRPDGNLTAASETFLFFGYGPHFCPGRFFMVRLLMVLLAYIVKHYDFEPTTTQRPVGIRAGFVNLPPLGTRHDDFQQHDTSRHHLARGAHGMPAYPTPFHDIKKAQWTNLQDGQNAPILSTI